MKYLNKTELTGLFQVAYNTNGIHHLAFVTALWHGLRVSELNALRGSDVSRAGELVIRRLKGSKDDIQPYHTDRNPLFDETPILGLAKMRGLERLYPYSRQYFDRIIKTYAVEAGIHPKKAHMHVLKHSVAMLLWDQTHDLGQIQGHLGHKAASSTLVYLAEDDKRKAQDALAKIDMSV
jgi:site-specific recombinase XerD